MNKFKCLLILVVSSAFIGCKSTYHVRRYQAPPHPISPQAAVFIVVPPDAKDEPGSGRFAADALLNAFRPYATRLRLSDEIAPLSMHLTNAAASGYTYLLDATIYQWEEEPTEWNGLSDKLDMRLRLLEAPAGAVVSETRIDAHCAWLSVGSRVEHLLSALAGQWARALYEGVDLETPPSKTQAKQ